MVLVRGNPRRVGLAAGILSAGSGAVQLKIARHGPRQRPADMKLMSGG